MISFSWSGLLVKYIFKTLKKKQQKFCIMLFLEWILISAKFVFKYFQGSLHGEFTSSTYPQIMMSSIKQFEMLKQWWKNLMW